MVMPSSPPPYSSRRGEQNEAEVSEDEQVIRRAKDQQPRAMKYKLVEPASDQFSENDLSRSSSFQHVSAQLKHARNPSSTSVSGLGSVVIRHEGQEDGVDRAVSGQSIVRNEGLSPIYVARHNTIDGKIDYAALDLPAEELQQHLHHIYESSVEETDAPGEESEARAGNNTYETDDFAHNGHFVNVRRGGHSEEGSFQKRMLSPSSLPPMDESALLPEESMQASTPKHLPNIRKTRTSNEYKTQQPPAVPSPPALRTPQLSPTKPGGHQSKGSTGSPLKLFGTYDTFTNQKLLRRLSQFEGNIEDSINSEDISKNEFSKPELNDAFVAVSSLYKTSTERDSDDPTTRKFKSFGEGDLDSFQFSEEVSYDLPGSGEEEEEEDKENTSLPVLDRTQSGFKFHLDSSAILEEEEDGYVRRRRQTSTTNTVNKTVSISVRRTIRPATASSPQSPALAASQILENLQTPRKRNGDLEGKRLLRTPSKNPTPKRRRTLQKTDLEEQADRDETDLDSLRETHQQMQSVIGRKRKDARHGDDQQAANPKVLAMRQILRPRTPTPSQRSSQILERPPLSEIKPDDSERARLLQVQKIARIQAELDSVDPLKMSMVLSASMQMQNDSRKGSVTTQDFLDEAKKIMAGIRDKVRPRSGLTSLEESESENDRNQSSEARIQEEDFEDSYQESTKEPFSRPPSREGGAPLPRLPLKQEDPALLDHLRKYQEKSDMDGVMASSMKSIAMAKEASETARGLSRIIDEAVMKRSGVFNAFDSDPPNITISENPEAQRKRKHSTSSVPAGSETHHDAEFPSQGSTASSGQSTRSIPTGSSRGSDSRRIIAPNAVSHLIPEQLAGMVFDRERNIWIKRRNVNGDNFGYDLTSDETEEDPFGDIPDLSVDETQEMQRIKAVAAKRKEEARVAQDRDETYQSFDELEQSHELHDAKTTTKQHDMQSSEPSRITRFGSSDTVPQSITRSTSWGTDHTPVVNSSPTTSDDVHSRRKVVHSERLEEVVEEVEREISIHEDRVNQSPQRKRNITITFSSPLASIIETPGYGSHREYEHDASDNNQSDNGSEDVNDSLIVNRARSSRKSTTSSVRSAIRTSSRRTSVAGHKFPARPVSRIDEQDEESGFRESQTHRNISIIVATPAQPTRATSVMLVTPRPSHEIGTLELTPLSDFTMNQYDESLGLDVSYVAHNQRYKHGNENKRTLSLSIKDLVEKLTEVEPYEPFWEQIKDIDLRNKRLTNLHKLDEFCEHLEELDVSHNNVSQLDGVPRNLRRFRITHNSLTDLAAWGHLSNLQYVDISNNELESLSAFKSLFHLRSLRADNNRIESLDGINQLDSLLSLRLRGNRIKAIDFGDSKLQRLTDLDLKENHISDVRNLEELRSLATLNLEDNHISVFSSLDDQHLALKYLKLSGNNLESIDVGQYPNLRLLYLDRNRLSSVAGLHKTKHLDSLSMREQHESTIIDTSFFASACEVRKLFLSGNLLTTFNPETSFLNLQYLELANCGLESLPEDFGHMFMNVRVLNLNFNALRDIQPLFGISRLKKLHLAGNRITRLRMTTTMLAQFPSLTLADLRGNPLSLGFYPPLLEMRMIAKDEFSADEQDSFTLGKADKGNDVKYAGRLDMDTKMLRRVYEILVLGGCQRLRTLDGLEVDRSVPDVKDNVWEALVKAGVVVDLSAQKSNGNDNMEFQKADRAAESVELTEPAEKVVEEERWHAEDSFA